ncbi:MAG: phenylalanine 4-monooxygenase [Cypionkella sp.]|uniref:phenylalanine 4-monooxygenase n=1 Tax=Cypionkella sp. TaxID=2811411 RepID=UPI002ABA63E3|nr:phenylalanine 4-monooxygenase [Cypionkella sp.]MDZ4311220.1 phenylalanine 4-monooxygenase [Cypionkella sp.]
MPKSTDYVAKQPDAAGRILYDSAEDSVWHDLMMRQMPSVEERMATPYLEGLALLDLPSDRVAQCKEVSQTLGATTGWRVEPVPALIPFGRFFSLLADRCFPAASFIRRREHFDYIEEPDIFHEIFGHAPLLTDARFAAFSHAIGQAGMQAEKTDYVWLIRLYWFSIEFGLTRENGEIKGLGSGLASSIAELQWAISDKPELRPFDVIDILRMPYRIDILQPVYFLIEDLDDLFAAAQRNLLADVATARALGLHAARYPARRA